MASLQQLLNPCDRVPHTDVVSMLKAHGALKHLFPSSHSGSSSSSSDQHGGEPLEDKLEWAHAYHENCPDSLDCLPDTDGKPQYTLPVILRCVILGSAKKRLTIREIYAAMEKKYPYYKSAAPAWKQSVRHHLSLSRLFEKVAKPVTDPGFGSYWTVNLDAPKGTKRPRKRGRAFDQTSIPQTIDERFLHRSEAGEPLQAWTPEHDCSNDPASPTSTTSAPATCYPNRYLLHRVHPYGTERGYEEGYGSADVAFEGTHDRLLVEGESDDDGDAWMHPPDSTETKSTTLSHGTTAYPYEMKQEPILYLQEQIRSLQRQLEASKTTTEKLASELSDAHAEIARLRLRNELFDRGIGTGVSQRNL